MALFDRARALAARIAGASAQYQHDGHGRHTLRAGRMVWQTRATTIDAAAVLETRLAQQLATSLGISRDDQRLLGLEKPTLDDWVVEQWITDAPASAHSEG